jgi:hypothetical protein
MLVNPPTPTAQLLPGTGVGLTAGGTTQAPTITVAAYAPTTATLANGELTLDTATAGIDSKDVGQTPTSGQMLFQFFRARSSWSGMKFITTMGLGQAPASLTLVKASLWSYDGSTNLTLMDGTADVHAAYTGSFTAHKMALAAQTANIVQGNLYALALLQVGTTPGSLAGTTGYPAWSLGETGTSWKSGILTGQTDTPAGPIAVSSLGSGGGPFMMLASVTTS